MKNIICYSIVFALLSVSIFSCAENESQDKGADNMNTQTGVEYTCPMHPEIVSNEAGKCPKCGMALVIKEKSGMMPDSIMKGDSSMKM